MIIKLLQILNKNIDYCILRGYQNIPEKFSRDIDICIKKDEFNLFESCLNKFCLNENIYFKTFTKRYGYKSFVFFSKEESDFFKIDVWDQITYRGLEYISSNQVVNNRVRFKNFYISSKFDEIKISYFKEILHNKKSKDKYWHEFEKYIKENGVVSLIKNTFFYNKLNLDINLFLRKKESLIANEFRKNLRSYWLKKSIFIYLLKKYNFLRYKLLDILKYNFSPLIILIGPDGSGKTTTLNIFRNLENILFKKIKTYHGKFGILPNLRSFIPKTKIIRKKYKNEKEYPDSKKPYSVFRALVNLFYYSLEYFLGNFIIIFSKINKKTIIFDRYYYDYFIQFQWNNINTYIKKILFCLVSKGNILIYLDCDAKKINQRKPELSVDSILSQQKRSKEIIKNHKMGWKINTSISIEETKKQIYKNIYKNYFNEIK